MRHVCAYLLECALALCIAEVIRDDISESLLPLCSVDGKEQLIS